MQKLRHSRMAAAVLWLLVIAALAVPAQTSTASQDAKSKADDGKSAPGKQAPTPLFGGKLGTRSSQKTKESATLGFNGIDPSGKVDKKMLAANPKSTDIQRVRNLDAMRPTPSEIAAFVKAEGLKAK